MVQESIAILLGSYYAGLYGLAAPELKAVSYILLGTVVLMYVQNQRGGAPGKSCFTAPVILLASYVLLLAVPPAVYKPTDMIDDNIPDHVQTYINTAIPALTPQHRSGRLAALALLGVTAGVAAWWCCAGGTAPGGDPTSWTWYARLSALGLWVVYVAWVMYDLGQHALVDLARRDLIPGGQKLVSMSTVVGKMYMHLAVGLVIFGCLALVPHKPLPGLCVVYLFLGFYFLGHMYNVKRALLIAEERQGQPPPSPSCTYKVGAGLLLLAVVALLGTQRLTTTHRIAGFGVIALACWDTHLTERLGDMLV